MNQDSQLISEAKVIVIEKQAERSPIEIDMAILEACKTLQLLSHLILHLRMNTVTLKERITVLSQKGFLNILPKYRDNKGKINKSCGNAYFTSVKGRELLVLYHSFLKLYKNGEAQQ